MEYVGKIKQEDEDWVTNIWAPREAKDQDLQKRLDLLYNTNELREMKDSVQQQLMPTSDNERCAMLAMFESSIQIKGTMRQQ